MISKTQSVRCDDACDAKNGIHTAMCHLRRNPVAEPASTLKELDPGLYERAANHVVKLHEPASTGAQPLCPSCNASVPGFCTLATGREHLHNGPESEYCKNPYHAAARPSGPSAPQPSTPAEWRRQESCAECDGDGCANCTPQTSAEPLSKAMQCAELLMASCYELRRSPDHILKDEPRDVLEARTKDIARFIETIYPAPSPTPSVSTEQDYRYREVAELAMEYASQQGNDISILARAVLSLLAAPSVAGTQPTPDTTELDALRRDLSEAKKDAESWKHHWQMYRDAWVRELGGWLVPKSHEIDALVLTTRKRCVNPLLGNCNTPHWLGKPTEDRKALTQTPHPRENSCKDWQFDDPGAAQGTPQVEEIAREIASSVIGPLLHAAKREGKVSTNFLDEVAIETQAILRQHGVGAPAQSGPETFLCEQCKTEKPIAEQYPNCEDSTICNSCAEEQISGKSL